MDNNTPTKHYGFAQVPRMVLRGQKYKKKLSLAEKGLYACLKDICGEKGECYFSLRHLAEEIDTSASTLTRYIPELRDKGLIYAEKKIRGTGENKHEIWHIRIVDIWKENDALYKTQDCSDLKQSSVSNCNEDTGLFQNETEVFQNETKIVSFCLPNNNNSNNNQSNDTREYVASETAPLPPVASATPSLDLSSQSSLFSSEETKPQEKTTSKRKRTEASSETKRPPETPPADMPWGTKKCLLKFDAWRGHTLIGHYKLMQASSCAKGLAEQYTEQEVEQVYKLMNETPYWIERGGADVCDVSNNIHKEIKKARSQQGRLANDQPTENKTRPSALVSEEQRQRNIARLRANAQKEGAIL